MRTLHRAFTGLNEACAGSSMVFFEKVQSAHEAEDSLHEANNLSRTGLSRFLGAFGRIFPQKSRDCCVQVCPRPLFGAGASISSVHLSGTPLSGRSNWRGGTSPRSDVQQNNTVMHTKTYTSLCTATFINEVFSLVMRVEPNGKGQIKNVLLRWKCFH